VRGVSLAEKKRLIEGYNGLMLGVQRHRGSQASTATRSPSMVRESRARRLHELRPEITLVRHRHRAAADGTIGERSRIHRPAAWLERRRVESASVVASDRQSVTTVRGLAGRSPQL